MKKRRQFKNIKAATDSRQRQKTDLQHKNVIITKLKSEIEQHRTERMNLEKYYESKVDLRVYNLESALQKQEEAVNKQAKLYQNHIENVIYMLKQDYHRNIIEEELVKLSQNIAGFSANFGPTTQPLDLSTKS